jgi:uncharacterized protein (TIGR02646 family)
MRRVSRGTCPTNLDGPLSIGHKEREDAIAFFDDANQRNSDYKFRQYKEASVKQQLTLEYREKCAYCESLVAHVAPLDIDHFRPKGAYREPSGAKDVKPGYYWLASDWDNLFPSCLFCNRRNSVLLADGKTVTVGKGTHFPLADETKRATLPGTEGVESPLLLNPNQVDVESHLEFGDDGVVVPAISGSLESPRGKQSIEIFGLQRASLVAQRAKHLRRVKSAIARYERERQMYIDTPNDSRDPRRLKDAMTEVRAYLCCRQEYLAMTRQHIAKECKELIPLPSCADSSCIGPNF